MRARWVIGSCLSVVVGASGCFTGLPEDGAWLCPEGACPTGFVCAADQRCYRDGHAPVVAGGGDDENPLDHDAAADLADAIDLGVDAGPDAASSCADNPDGNTFARGGACLPRPVANWRLDEGSGTVARDREGRFDGVLTNGAGWAAGPRSETHAASFGGVDDRVSIGDPPGGELDFGLASFSYALWVYAESHVGSADIPFFKGGSSNGTAGYDIELGTGSWNANISDGEDNVGDEATVGLGVAAPGTWVHLAVVVDRAAGVLRGYRDGVLVGEVSIVGIGSVSNGHVLTLGCHPNNVAYYFHGRIADVVVFDRALGADQVAALAR